MSSAPFARPLLAWFRATARDLPWRRERSPYTTVVSEVMLQQTTVATVVPRFERFVARFPDWSALADARPAAELAEWAGLGYYRRARNLHALARALIARGGAFPRDLATALELPGIGPYTAGAVLSLTHGIPVPAVDGNVMRVISRHRARAFRPASSADRREVECVVMALQPTRAPGAFNEALMELGATTCTPRAPACPACPIAAGCRARELGRPEDFPAPNARPRQRRVAAAAAVIFRDGRVLLRRRATDAELLPGLWELPGGFHDGADARAFLGAEVLPAFGGGVVLEEVGVVRHAITDRSITLALLRCRLRALRDRAPACDGSPQPKPPPSVSPPPPPRPSAFFAPSSRNN